MLVANGIAQASYAPDVRSARDSLLEIEPGRMLEGDKRRVILALTLLEEVLSVDPLQFSLVEDRAVQMECLR